MASVDRSAGSAAPDEAWPALARLAVSVVLIAAGAVAVCCLVGVTAVATVYLRDGFDGLLDFYQELRFDAPLQTLLGACFVGLLYIGIIAATLCAAVWRERWLWAARIALMPARWRRPATAAIFATTLGYAATASLVMNAIRDHRVIISGPTDVVLLTTITANLVVLAPLAEEFFFRGWLYTGLRRHLAFWPSFVLTTCLFAAIHWDAGHRRIFLVLPLAVALGLLREATGSIKPTIILHAVYNLIIVAITLLET